MTFWMKEFSKEFELLMNFVYQFSFDVFLPMSCNDCHVFIAEIKLPSYCLNLFFFRQFLVANLLFSKRNLTKPGKFKDELTMEREPEQKGVNPQRLLP